MKKLLFAFAFIIASVQASLPDWYADPVYNVAAVRQAVGDDQPLTATAEAALGRFFDKQTELPVGVERKDFALFLAAHDAAPDVEALEKKVGVLGQLETVQSNAKNNFAALVGRANGSMESASVALLAGFLDGDAYYLYNHGLNTAYSVFVRTNTMAVRYNQRPMDVLQTIGTYHQLWLGEAFEGDLYQAVVKAHQQQIEGEKVFAENRFDPVLVGRAYLDAQYSLDKDDFFVPEWITESYLEKKQQLAEAHAYVRGLRIQLAKASTDKNEEVLAKAKEAIACIVNFWGQEGKPKRMPFGWFEWKGGSKFRLIRNRLSDPHGVVISYFEYYMSDFDYMTSLFFFYSDALELKKAIENLDLPYHFFHGANSGILPAIESSKALIPTGFFGKYDIVALSGELASGSTEYGVNNTNLSGANETYKGIECAWRYATRTDFGLNPEGFIDHRDSFVNKSKALPENLTREAMESLYETYFVELKSAIHGFPHRIRQFKKAGVWKDDPEFRAAMERNVQAMGIYVQTESYRDYLPKAEGGRYSNYYYYRPFKECEGILRDCLNALDADIEPISAEEAERLKPENLFPVMFASALPGQVVYNLDGELRYNALLSLRHDIDAIFVPEDKMDYMHQWLVDNGIVVDGKGPKVLDIASVKTYARDYADFFKPEGGAAAAAGGV